MLLTKFVNNTVVQAATFNCFILLQIFESCISPIVHVIFLQCLIIIKFSKTFPLSYKFLMTCVYIYTYTRYRENCVNYVSEVWWRTMVPGLTSCCCEREREWVRECVYQWWMLSYQTFLVLCANSFYSLILFACLNQSALGNEHKLVSIPGAYIFPLGIHKTL